MVAIKTTQEIVNYYVDEIGIYKRPSKAFCNKEWVGLDELRKSLIAFVNDFRCNWNDGNPLSPSELERHLNYHLGFQERFFSQDNEEAKNVNKK